MSRQTQLLIVDDDLRLSRLLQRYLIEQDFSVGIAANGNKMDEKLSILHIDLIILDLMMPGEDGLSICRRLRAQNCQIPIIMLTAKGDDIERIIGLEIGADDYLPKPCNPRELVARIKAVLRRQPPITPGNILTDHTLIRFGENILNLGTRELTNSAGLKRLTSSEFGVLKVLTEHPNRPLSRDQLLSLGRGRSFESFDRSIDVQISQLRKLVEQDPSKPRYIQTVWGTGYVFVPDKDSNT